MKAKKLIEAGGDDEEIQGEEPGEEEAAYAGEEPPSEMTIRDRAERAAGVIARYVGGEVGGEEEGLSDLLADLMHYADLRGMVFRTELLRAVRNYEAEKSGEIPP